MQEIQKRLNKLYHQRELRSRSFDPHPNLYISYSHLQKDIESNGMILNTAKYLRLTADELIERYSQEKPLSIKVNELEWKLPHTCIFDNTLQQLSLSNIVVEQDRISPQYIIPTRLETKASDVLEEIGDFFHDSTTIRLNQIIQDIDKLTLVVSKAHYLDHIATNYAMDALLVERGWTKSLRDIINPGKRLEPLETSLLANHIGVSVLIITSDNYLILPIRSHEKVSIWHKQVMPSISGAASYDEDMWSTRKGPVAAWMREGREELGLENSNFEEPGIFLGITREFLRGGKPELFFTTHITLTKTKLEQKFHKARDKWENKELRWFEFSVPLTPLSTEDERQMFLDDFLRLMKQYQNILSQSLQANLALWFKYMMSL